MEEKNDNKVKEQFKQYCDSQSWCTFKCFSKDKHACWDCSYYSADTKGNQISVIAEIKGKDLNPSTKRNSWLLTRAKYEDLNRLKIQMQIKYPQEQFTLQYIHIFPDNQLYIWNIDDISKRKPLCYLTLPSTTYFGTPTMSSTPIYYMHKEETLINESINIT